MDGEKRCGAAAAATRVAGGAEQGEIDTHRGAQRRAERGNKEMYSSDEKQAWWRQRRARLAAMTILMMLFNFGPFPFSAGQPGPGLRAVFNGLGGYGAPGIAEAVTPWDGTTTKEPVRENGTYLISDARELAWAAQIGSRTASYRLTADIDLAGRSWTPIGPNTLRPFGGTFDGAGHTIHGLLVDGERTYGGLFGYTTQNARIFDLRVSGLVVSTDMATGELNAGGLVALNQGTIERCSAYGIVRTSNAQGVTRAGMLAGRNTGTVTDCDSGGLLVASGATTGPISRRPDRL